MKDIQAAILDACLRGDRAAQRNFYDHFKGRMFPLCLRYANNRQEAEDILQEGFIKVFRDIHQYRGAGSLDGWVRKVFLHTALHFLRKQQQLIPTADLEKHAYRIGEDQDTETESDHTETAALLLRLMHRMPPGFRTVLNLYVLEGYSHQEIAAALDISVGTSKSQLNRAKAHLRALLEQQLAS
ncbi:MAG: hypothetical protein RLY31_1199 [Bacteroidota bacterium]|jgi:RNA polymerase sigma-70 factor (ECF subfamily)